MRILRFAQNDRIGGGGGASGGGRAGVGTPPHPALRAAFPSRGRPCGGYPAPCTLDPIPWTLDPP